MAELKTNVGRLKIGDKVISTLEGMNIDWAFNAIKFYAADRQFPLFIGHGNSELNIDVDTAEFRADSEYAVETIARNGQPVDVEVLAGIRGGGIPATLYTNCVVTQYTITAKQGDIVKAKITLSKQADS